MAICGPTGTSVGSPRSNRGVPINLPDGLALSRIVLVIPIMVLIRSPEVDSHLAFAAVLFGAAAITDYLDGYFARRRKRETIVGGFLDTTADKILVTGVLLALVSVDLVSIWPASIIIFREFTVMALRGVVAAQGGIIRPSAWGKIKTLTQFGAIFLAFLRLSEPWGPWYLDQWVMLIAVLATLASAWGYLAAFWHTVRAEPAGIKA